MQNFSDFLCEGGIGGRISYVVGHKKGRPKGWACLVGMVSVVLYFANSAMPPFIHSTNAGTSRL